MSRCRLTAEWSGHTRKGVFFVRAAPIGDTDWLDGQRLSSPVKHDSVIVPAGAVVCVEQISPTVTDAGTGEPIAQVLFRVTEGRGRPWYWHRLSVTPDRTGALNALGLKFTRPRATW